MGQIFPWIVSAAKAVQIIGRDALVLDVRKDDLRQERPLVGAIALPWQQLTYPEHPDKGRLLDDDAALGRVLSAVGIRNDTPVIVVADSLAGGGEDGRVTWALRSLGHTKAAFVEGGIHALGGFKFSPRARDGAFVVHRTTQWEASREQLRDAIGASGTAILDTRELREYRGETPYGESRGGFVPGARHLWYRDLIRPDGGVLDKPALDSRLEALGIGLATEIIAYCTGGVRAGFVTSVLTNAGYRVRNYAGSMWHWAAGDDAQFPLVRS